MRNTKTKNTSFAIPKTFKPKETAFPSPGEYEIGKSIISKNTLPFSKAARFGDLTYKKLPGPGSYHPLFDMGKQSFRLNLENTWI
jgi:hypothetical protein